MFARFDYNLSKKDYVCGLKAMSRSLHDRNPNLRRRYILPFALLGVALVLASLLVPGTTDLVLSVYLVTLAVGCFAQTRFAEHWRAITFDAARSSMSLTVEDSGLTLAQPDIERRYAWKALRRIHDLPEAVILEMADWHAISMPGALWSDLTNRAEFVAGMRTRADALDTDLPPVGARPGPTFLTVLGVVALGLNLMIWTPSALRRFGFDNSSPASQTSVAGQLLAIVPFIVYVVVCVAAWAGLLRLRRHYPRLATWLAITSIALFVALQAIPPAVQIFRFFSRQAP